MALQQSDELAKPTVRRRCRLICQIHPLRRPQHLRLAHAALAQIGPADACLHQTQLGRHGRIAVPACLGQ